MFLYLVLAIICIIAIVSAFISMLTEKYENNISLYFIDCSVVCSMIILVIEIILIITKLITF